MSKKRVTFLVAAIAVTAAIVASLTTWFAMNQREEGMYLTNDEYDTLMSYYEMQEVNKIINENFYEDVDQQKVLVGALKGMVAALGDKYSAYYTKEEFASYKERLDGNFDGLGFQMKKDEATGYAQITKIVEGSAAEKAKIPVGSYITEVEGQNTRDLDLETIVSMVQQVPEGTDVHLKIKTDGEEKEYNLTCIAIQIPSVRTNMLTSKIGYINILEFSDHTSDEFKKALESLGEEGAESMVLDLRQNPGGLVKQTTEVADMMLSEGKTIVYTQDKTGEKSSYTSTEEILWDKPIVILVDSVTASSAEILAGALQDNERAEIVGEQTFGKGIIQSLIDIPQTGAGVKITSATYFTPNGNNINGKGITPDHVVENKSEDLDEEKDDQMDYAVELLGGYDEE